MALTAVLQENSEIHGMIGEAPKNRSTGMAEDPHANMTAKSGGAIPSRDEKQ